jgi:hypothetical protein
MTIEALLLFHGQPWMLDVGEIPTRVNSSAGGGAVLHGKAGVSWRRRPVDRPNEESSDESQHA